MPTDTLLNTLLVVQHLNNDLLSSVENSNEQVLKAVEHLKTDLKPLPKTIIETYGVVIGAALGILGSVITFNLTKRKEKKVFLAQLYGDITSAGHALRGAMMLKGVEQINFEAALKRTKLFPGSQEHSALFNEINIKLDKLTTETLNAGKDFFSKVGTYIFVMEGKTVVKNFRKNIDENSFTFSATTMGEDITTIDQVNDIFQQDIERFKQHFETALNSNVIAIEEAVLKCK